MRLHTILAAAALAACTSGKHVDEDGDGVVASVDCDDADPAVFPGAADVCDGMDNDCDDQIDEDAIGGSTWFLDADDDGYGSATSYTSACEAPDGYVDNTGDCDDDDDEIHPDAPEICDGHDNDCDLEIDGSDEDLVWFLDQDGDGYGTTDEVAVGCEAPEGYVDNALDCDDGDAAVSPVGAEICDEVDNNCDGAVDEAATDGRTVYWDQDGDGYGSPDTTWTGCTLPEGYVDNDDDCDDEHASCWPGGVEICDGLDNDCDEETDEEPTDGLTWYLDADADGYGTPDTTATACDAPAGYADSDGDCDDSAPDTHPDAEEVCDDGADNNCDESAGPCGVSGEIHAADADFSVLGGMSNDYAGRALATGDLNADGEADLVIGASGYDGAATAAAGAAYVLAGPLTVSKDLSTGYTARVAGTVGYSYTGTAVATPDHDGDGTSDLLIGAWGASTSAGAVYLAYGGAGAVSGNLGPSDMDATWTGAASYDFLGYSAASAGDMDGDGTDDIVVGAYGYDGDSTSLGGAWLVYGGATPRSGSEAVSDAADAMWSGSGAGTDTYAGWVVASAGDLDGDGLSELLIGAKWDDIASYDAGATYVVYGDAVPHSGAMTTADADAWVYGDDASDHMGYTASAAGDADGDGYGDFLTGAPDTDTSSKNAVGEAWLITGGASRSSGSLSATTTFQGAAAYDYLGDGVGTAGDIDGDGEDDLVIGAYGEDTATSSAGAAYLFRGPVATGTLPITDADATLYGASTGDGYFGRTFGTPGDVDGDGQSDLLVGAYYDDTYASGAGAVYVFLGGGL